MKKKILTISLISVFSILLWVFVSLSHDFFTTANFPVEFINVPKGYVLSNLSDEFVSISLKGEGWLLGQILFGRSPKFVIDINDRKGKLKIVTKNFINTNGWLSSNLQIIEIAPPIITLKVVRSAEKIVKINSANIHFAAKDGYIASLPLELQPESVSVLGPQAKVKKLKEVFTEPENLADLQKTTSLIVKLKPIKDIIYSRQTVRATIKIEKIADKTFTDIPVKVVKVPYGRKLEVFPPKIKISLRGGLNQLAQLKSAQIKAFIYYSQALKDTTGALSPKIVVPDNLELLTIEPKKLKYIIKR